MAFVRIYTTFQTYKDLPSNKTVDFSAVCSHIARIKYLKGDLGDALSFYREAETHAEGENEKKSIQAAIEEIEKESEQQGRQPMPIREELIKELSHELDDEE